MKTRPIISRTELFLSTKVVTSVFSVLITVCTLFLLTDCKNDTTKSETKQVTTDSAEKVHVAFAGGGWRAHTAHSAWTISLLDNGTKKLNDIFSNVGTVSSNSGGSWFSTMLMYSADFVSDIEAKDAANSWTTTSGWTGKQRKLFDAAGCNNKPEDIYLECVFDYYTNVSFTGGTYWKLVVEDLVFRDYSLGGTTLKAPHQTWAADKSLLLASTLLTNTAVLNSENDLGNNHNYYQACLSPATPVLDGDSGSDCSNGIPPDVTPVTFSSVPKSADYQPSPFLSELGTNTKSSVFNLGYTADFVFKKAPEYASSLELPLHSDNVPVMVAAAASSAALGFGASERITGIFDLSYTLADDAVSFGLANSNVQYVNTEGIELEELANQKVVRLADGGAVDNSGVAQLVRSLQLNNQAEGFNIVAFDNVSTITNPRKGAANVGVDIASLFGFKDSLCIDIKVAQYCIIAPDLQIFDSTPLYSTAATWTYEAGGNQLVYTKYEITTKENVTLGISRGTRGTLHSFTCAYPDAATAPVDGDTNFDAYAAMFKFINSGLNKNNGEGLKHLQAALGL
ncbi:hypothetical protein [Winogradskyella sp.]|uniref:hypothetical protein n=1 Tax=Winogradskyella sp. TaxID=1883156 RepID=UPI003BA9B0C8